MTKKEKLLKSAKKLFAVQGFDKTSIRDIANDANVNSSMISYYFGGKEGMIQGIFEYYFPDTVNSTDMTEPINEIRKIISDIILLRVHDTELIDILHSEIILHSPRLDGIKPHITAPWFHLYNLLVECQSNGSINIRTVEVAYMYLLAGISFPYHNQMFQITTKTIEIDQIFVDELVNILMKGLT